MSSILLAFGIDAWWDSRQSRQAEGNLLVGLKREFELNRAQLDSVLSLHGRQAAQFAHLAQLKDSALLAIPPDSLTAYARALAQGRTFDAFGGQLDAILSADRLQIIRDEGLRTLLVVWQARLADSGEEAQLMQNASELVVHRMAQLGGPYLLGNPTEALSPVTAAALATFVRDDDLMTKSRAKFFYAAGYLNEVRGLLSQAQLILERIAAFPQ